MIYADGSALVKLYLEEAESVDCQALVRAEAVATARHSIVEVRRAIARGSDGETLEELRRRFRRDLRDIALVELDETICETAAQIAESTGLRTGDALHLAAAERLGGASAVRLLTYDRTQAQAARSLGFTVLGA